MNAKKLTFTSLKREAKKAHKANPSLTYTQHLDRLSREKYGMRDYFDLRSHAQKLMACENSDKTELPNALPEALASKHFDNPKKGLYESPAFTIAQELEASSMFKTLRHFQKSPTFEALQSLDKGLRNFGQNFPKSPAFEALQSLDKGLRDFGQNFPKSPAFEALQSLDKRLRDFGQSFPKSPAFEMLRNLEALQAHLAPRPRVKTLQDDFSSL